MAPRRIELTGNRPSEATLPGGIIHLLASDSRMRAPALKSAGAIHGLVTALFNDGHDLTAPRFSLMFGAGNNGWSVYVHDRARGLSVAGKTTKAMLGRSPIRLACSPLYTVRLQQPSKWERRVVLVETITPIVVRCGPHGAKRSHSEPTGAGLVSSLVGVASAIGFACPRDLLEVDVIVSQTKPTTVYIGGGPRTVRGYAGCFAVMACPTARLLLSAAEVVGLGARVGYGFGQIATSVQS